MSVTHDSIANRLASKVVADGFSSDYLITDPKGRLKTELGDFVKNMSFLSESLAENGGESDENLAHLSELINSLCEACADFRNIASGDDVAAARAMVQEALSPWTSQSWFMNQAINRPRGYPGDYQILEGFYDNRVKSDNPMGALFDRWILSTPLVRSVRGRKERCKAVLEELATEEFNESLRLMKVSSGPCRELQESKILREHGELFFYGIDRDDGAVSYAGDALLQAGYDHDSLMFEKKIACRVRSKNYISQDRFDLVYCTGLYDFLPDKQLVSLFSGVSNLLAEDGMHLIVLKDSSKYDITSCEWVVSWTFFERTEKKCRDLIDQAGLKVEKMWRDQTEIMMFFLAKPK